MPFFPTASIFFLKGKGVKKSRSCTHAASHLPDSFLFAVSFFREAYFTLPEQELSQPFDQ